MEKFAGDLLLGSELVEVSILTTQLVFSLGKVGRIRVKIFRLSEHNNMIFCCHTNVEIVFLK